MNILCLVCFQMDILSLNNDDEYASEDAGSEQEMDENNPIVDESLMSTAEGKDPATCKSKTDYIRKKVVKFYGVYKKNSSAHSSQEVEEDALPAGYGVSHLSYLPETDALIISFFVGLLCVLLSTSRNKEICFGFVSE